MCNTGEVDETSSSASGAPLDSTSPPPLSQDPIITFKVGERAFRTKADTIEEYSFLKALVSPRWNSNKQADGSYFIDADPALFERILRYLRRGVFPIFYDKVKEHDHALYLALLEEAKYFQITRLQKWREGKGYLEAVKVRTSVAIPDEEASISFTETNNANVEVEIQSLPATRKVYVCPRNIGEHMGRPWKCGKQGNSAQPEEGPEYRDEEFVKTVVVRTETIFDRNCCLEGRQEGRVSNTSGSSWQNSMNGKVGGRNRLQKRASFH